MTGGPRVERHSRDEWINGKCWRIAYADEDASVGDTSEGKRKCCMQLGLVYKIVFRISYAVNTNPILRAAR